MQDIPVILMFCQKECIKAETHYTLFTASKHDMTVEPFYQSSTLLHCCVLYVEKVNGILLCMI